MDLTKIVLVVLTIISAIVTGIIIPLIKAKTKKADIDYVMGIVSIAVNAAEQIYKQSGMGKEKKAYVLNFLKSKGVKVSEDELDKMIESCVLEITKWKKELETPVVIAEKIESN